VPTPRACGAAVTRDQHRHCRFHRQAGVCPALGLACWLSSKTATRALGGRVIARAPKITRAGGRDSADARVMCPHAGGRAACRQPTDGRAHRTSHLAGDPGATYGDSPGSVSPCFPGPARQQSSREAHRRRATGVPATTLGRHGCACLGHRSRCARGAPPGHRPASPGAP
jgi:hypothetical protein